MNVPQHPATLRSNGPPPPDAPESPVADSPPPKVAASDTSLGMAGATVDWSPPAPGLAATVAPAKQTFAETNAWMRPRGGSLASPPIVPGYEIAEELGRGGMGVVYRARQVKLDRVVALKMVLAGAHADAEQLARFYTEAQAVAHLRHAHIVQIHEVGEVGGLPYFSLEFLEGGSLAEKFGAKPQPVREAAQIVEKLARAMAYAHQHGIIHRDLKPANVLLTVEGEPKISDFGLAKRLEGDSGQTQSGTIVGTPNYMSPEQARGETREVGPAADIYALGVILYQALTGRTPFLGSSILDTLEQVRNHDPVPPSRLQPTVPRDLEVLCLKCLEKEQAKRYETAAALADDLRRFLDGIPILARPVSAPERLWRWCRRNQRVAALSFLVLLLLTSLAVGSTVAAVVMKGQAEELRVQRDAATRNESLAKAARDDALRNEQAAQDARALAEANEHKAVTAQAQADQNAQAASQQAGLALDALGILVNKVQTQLQDTPATQRLRQDLLATAQDGLQRVARSAASAHLMNVTMAQSHQRMGKIFESLGQTAEARRQYEACHAILAEIARQTQTEPQRSVAQRNLSSSFNALGDVNLLLGEKEVAERHYQDAFRLREALATANPTNLRAQGDLATSHIKLGNLATGDRAEAMFQQALELRQRVAAGATAASRSAAQRDVWIVYNSLAIVATRKGQSAAALRWYQQALELAQGILAATPESPRAQTDVATSRTDLGNAYRRSGDDQLARQHYGEALVLLQPLAEQDPENLVLQATYALVLARSGRHVEAAQQAEAMRRIAPQNHLNLFNVACCYAQCLASVARPPGSAEATVQDTALQDAYRQQCLESLRTAVAEGLTGAADVAADADLAGLVADPEFQALLKSIP